MSKSSAAHRRSRQLLDKSCSVVLVVDIQQKLLPVIPTASGVTARVEFLMDVANILQVPVVVSEQYPRGLGSSIPVVAEHPSVSEVVEKINFSAAEALLESKTYATVRVADVEAESVAIRQVVIVGIEGHICVLQTALDLLQQGLQVFVVEDAVGSRRQSDCDNALNRIQAAGGTVCVSESVAFEWCERAGSDQFKSISNLVRNRSQ